MEIQNQDIERPRVNWWIVFLAMGSIVLLFGYIVYNIETVKHQPCSICAKSLDEDIKCYYGLTGQIRFNQNGTIDFSGAGDFGRMAKEDISNLKYEG